jgi:uncharacterized integral membrane protein
MAIILILLCLVVLGVVFFTIALIVALLIARHELKRHSEKWRFG